MKKTTFSAIVASLFLTPLLAQQYVPDASFGNNGIFTAQYSTYSSQYNSFDFQSDDKILTAGYSMVDLFEYRGFITRHFANGSPETSFADNGFLECAEEITACSAVKVLEDDSFLVLESGGIVSYLKKYNSDGTVFENFGTNGSITVGDSPSGLVVIQSDGKIIVEAVPGLRRFNADGTPDTDYGINGFTDNENPYFKGFSIAIDENDSVIAAGHYYDEAEQDYDMMLVKYTSDGIKDVSFGNEGVVIIDTWGVEGDERITSVKLYGNKILVGGRVNNTMAVAKLNGDGTPYNDFGPNANGTSLIAFEGYSGSIAEIDLQEDGKIIASGHMLSTQAEENAKGSLVRITQEGDVDTSFGDGGKILISAEPGFACLLGCLRHLDNGAILVSGLSGEKAILAKFIPESVAGISEISAGVKVMAYPNPLTENSILQYSLQNDSLVTIELSDMQGKHIHTYADRASIPAGDHTQSLLIPAGLASGIYHVTVNTSKAKTTLKLIK